MSEVRDRPDIALLVPSFRGGGAEGATVRLANELARRGVGVDLLVLQSVGPWRDQLSPAVGQIDLKSRRALLGLWPLARYLRRARPRVIMAGPYHVGVLSILARGLIRCRTAVVVLEHNDLQAGRAYAHGLRQRLMPLTLRLTYPWADRVLAVSKGAAASLARLAGMPPDRVGVLYNGVDARAIQDAARLPVDHPWLTEASIPVIMAAGRLAPQKGYPDLLRAFALLTQSVTARLLVMGDGQQRQELQHLAADLGLAGGVQFLPHHPNPYAYMARASLFVLSSHFEGFGVVLLEALACGTPVVSTDCPSGPSEVLGGGRYGLLVPVGKPEALAAAMLQVLTDPRLEQRLRQAGPVRAAEFSIERAADRFLEVVSDFGVNPGHPSHPAVSHE